MTGIEPAYSAWEVDWGCFLCPQLPKGGGLRTHTHTRFGPRENADSPDKARKDVGMTRTTSFVMSLDSVYADKAIADDRFGSHNWPTPVHVWPVFFKIDGSTTHVDPLGKLVGTATVDGTDGVGPVIILQPGGSVTLPAELIQRTDQVTAIPLPPNNDRADVDGVFGFAIVLVQPEDLDSDVLAAAHAALNASIQTALNDLIANLPNLATSVGPELIGAVVKSVTNAIKDAVHDAMGFWDKVEGLLHRPAFGNSFAHFSQGSVPVAALDQLDFDPAGKGPAPFSWTGVNIGVSQVVLNGAIWQSRRTVKQTVLRRPGPPVGPVAGYVSADGYQHAIAAAGGEVGEWYWQGSGQVGSGDLNRFSQRVVALAGYSTTDNYQHVIAATDAGDLIEMYWQGGDSPRQSTLMHFDSRIIAIAGYASADGYQHVIVGTGDGLITEVYWQSGTPARSSLSHVPLNLVDVAGYEADGVHHVVTASSDGTLMELTWSGGSPASTAPFALVASHSWSRLLGVAAYQSAGERHVIVALSNGTIREFHARTAAVGQEPTQILHTDLSIMPGIMPMIDAYAEPSGDQHVIVATTDGAINEITWRPSKLVSTDPSHHQPIDLLK